MFYELTGAKLIISVLIYTYYLYVFKHKVENIIFYMIIILIVGMQWTQKFFIQFGGTE